MSGAGAPTGSVATPAGRGPADRPRADPAGFEVFAARRLAPHADRWDREQALPRSVVTDLARAGYLGALVPARYGGSGLDMVTFGQLNEAIGAACSSVRSVLTVHAMVTHAVGRWGSAAHRDRWLPGLAAGDLVAAFALSEPDAGSDAGRLAATATPDGAGYRLDGVKRWITYAQAADLFLVFARIGTGISAFLVPRDTPGLAVEPTTDLLGTRASMVGTVRLTGCRVGADALLGRPGFGLAAVAGSALGVGRYSVAAGCVGLARSCLDLSVRHAAGREQFGRPIVEHQLVARLVTDMATGVTAARLLCRRAGELQDAGDPESVGAVWMAKYAASVCAARSATDTVQILGAHGCGPDSPAQRMFRDAKIMEIIEGSTQLQQAMIARFVMPSRTAHGPLGTE